MIARPSNNTHGPRLEPFHKLQLTPEIAHSSSAVALSSVPGAKHLICGLMTFSKSSVSTYLIVNAHYSQEFQSSPHRERKLVQIFLELNRSFLLDPPSVRFTHSSVESHAVRFCWYNSSRSIRNSGRTQSDRGG